MRYLTPELIRSFLEEAKMIFISGPRQVGKTTLAKHLLALAQSESFYFNWDVDSHRKAILKKPEDFWRKETLLPATSKPRICLDEIHKYPRWKRFLKGLYDFRSEEIEILVTGSGRLDVYQRGGDSLVGRYHLYHLYPFTLGEILHTNRETVTAPDEFWKKLQSNEPPSNAEETLGNLEKFTGFPEPFFGASEARLRRWRRSHEKLVIREDLRDLTRIREIGLIESLVTLLPERVGSPLSINALREDLGVNFLTVKGWIEALGRLFYLFKIRPYSGRLARTLRKEEKVYLFDFSSIENEGARFENLVALHLMKLCDAWTEWGYGDFTLHYVRDREKREVDFLIAKERKPYALIEAKWAGDEIDSNLNYFNERLKPLCSVQLIRQPKKFKKIMKIKNISCVSASHFLSLI